MPYPDWEAGQALLHLSVTRAAPNSVLMGAVPLCCLLPGAGGAPRAAHGLRQDAALLRAVRPRRAQPAASWGTASSPGCARRCVAAVVEQQK